MRALVSPSDSRIRSTEARDSSIVVYLDYQLQTIEHIQESILVFELTRSISPSS